jgi:2-dehydropantoate 2-reductase
MQVVVLGAGAVGAYYGGLLARAGHEVTCFARGANLAALRAHGLEVRTPEGAFTASVVATDHAGALTPADVAILAVKSYSLEAMAPAVRHCAGQATPILPLLNGVETTERLERLGVPAAALLGGLTTISAARIAPGVVERKSPFQIVVAGELDGQSSERVSRIIAALRQAGVDARASGTIQVDLWQKFTFLAALAAVCGLTRSAVGPVRDHPVGRRLLRAAVAEIAAVGRARGVALPDGEVDRVTALIEGLPPGLKPSFLVDLESGGPTELDILSAAVSRFGQQAGIATPVHDVATLVLGHAAQTGGRMEG